MYLTYVYALRPTKEQHAYLARMLESARLIYNAALQERIEAYRKFGKTISYNDQQKSLPEFRECYEGPVRFARWPLRKVEDAFKAFFRRCKAKNGKAGFPRFRAYKRWKSFGFSEMYGVRIKGERLLIKGATPIRIWMPRPLEGEVKSCVVSRALKGWQIAIQVKIDTPEQDGAPTIGVDLGLTHLATLSTGERIKNPRVNKKAQRKLRLAQRALARCKRGSKRREKVRRVLARAHEKIKNIRRTYLHQQSAILVNQGGLAVEKLDVKGLIEKGEYNFSIHDAGWGMFLGFLRYKAEKAGTAFVEVDPRGTSQECSGCGIRVPKTLRDRWHSCSCGAELDRDHNAALNILARGLTTLRAVVSPGDANVAQQSERCLGIVN